MNYNQLDRDAILNIGTVISVKGRTVEVLVSKSKNSSILLYNGEMIKNVSVGSYIKIGKGFSELVGKIEGEYVSEDKNFNSKEYRHEKNKIKRILSITLLGYFDRRQFKQGIKELPLIDNECFLLNQEELDRVHNFIKIINGRPDEKLKIGKLSNDSAEEIEVGINSLFASHIGIFGNTGSGKSYTLSGLYYKLFKKFGNNEGFITNAKFLLIDFNGEFSEPNSITSQKKVHRLSTRKNLDEIEVADKIPLSEKAIVDTELLAILSNATDKTQKPFVSRVVKFYKSVFSKNDPLGYYKGILRNKVKDVLKMTLKDKAYTLVDSIALIVKGHENTQYNFDEVVGNVEWNNRNSHFMPRGTSRELTNEEIEDTPLYKSIEEYTFPVNTITKIIDFFNLQLVLDIYNDKALNEHIGPAINKLKSKTNDLQKVFNFDSNAQDLFSDRNFVVLDLNETNIDVKKIVPLIVCKQVYSNQKIKFRTDEKSYLNIIIDEAHNILSYSSERESSTWKDYRLETFEEIIKEGRKFGVFLNIASQRPSDISDTIISQLHNYFLHRLINNRDIQAVERTISYLDQVSFESLPILPTGTCILAGLSAHVPIVIEIDKIDAESEPKNKTIKPTDFWS
jgi:uncharacterized protein